MNLTPFLFVVYLAVINSLALFLMGIDKFSSRSGEGRPVSTGASQGGPRRARSQVSGEKRTPEGLLFFLAILGGSVGVYAGMMLLRHKTQKLYFILGIPLLIAQQTLLGYFAFSLFYK